MAPAGTRDQLIDAVVDHCLAFSDYIRPLTARQYASDFPRNLLNLLSNINQAIVERLQDLGSDLDFQSLEDQEAEQQVLRYSQLYSYLYLAACLVERADVPHTLVELIHPLRRLMQPVLEHFEVVLHPLPVLNYSFYPLGSELRRVVQEMGLGDLLHDLPRQFVAIGFPGLESARFLSHSIIAHELAHCLYLEQQLETIVLPLIRPDEEQLDRIAKDLAGTRIESGRAAGKRRAMQRTLSEYFSELEIRSALTTQMTNLSRSWVKELMCDAIGYRLFGTAYLFSMLTFLTSTGLLDDDRGTHPPNRMRLQLMYNMLGLEDPSLFKISHGKVKGFLKSWRGAIFQQPPRFSDPIRELAGNAILAIQGDLITMATAATGSVGAYMTSDYATELKDLVERIGNFVPPNELIENSTARAVKFQSILNAGWVAYLTKRESLQQRYNWETWECKTKLNELIARAVELNEIQTRWRELT